MRRVRDCTGSAGGGRVGRPLPPVIGQSARVSVGVHARISAGAAQHVHRPRACTCTPLTHARTFACAFPTDAASAAAASLAGGSAPRESAVRVEPRCNALVSAFCEPRDASLNARLVDRRQSSKTASARNRAIARGNREEPRDSAR